MFRPSEGADIRTRLDCLNRVTLGVASGQVSVAEASRDHATPLLQVGWPRSQGARGRPLPRTGQMDTFSVIPGEWVNLPQRTTAIRRAHP